MIHRQGLRIPCLRLRWLHLRWLRIQWRQLLRAERPRQTLAYWRGQDTAAVLVVCGLVGLLASWPWLIEPNLRPGMVSPFTLRAPRSATVVDSTTLEQRRQQMLPRTTVQVLDEQANTALRQRLDSGIQAIEEQSGSSENLVKPVRLSEQERSWLQSLSPLQRTAWEREIRQAQLRMLSQGLAPGVAEGQLLQAATLQLEQQPKPARELAPPGAASACCSRMRCCSPISRWPRTCCSPCLLARAHRGGRGCSRHCRTRAWPASATAIRPRSRVGNRHAWR